MKKFTKIEAIQAAEVFVKEVREMEEKHGLKLNSDTGDVYLSFQKRNPGNGNLWDSVKIGWDGDGSGLKVKEVDDEEVIRQQALAKLSPRERKVLGLE
ncbi:MAG: hypothetical protein AABY15_06490 [Nanoarchaeota archaeon]